jgi:5-methylcytosine-specific restriction enzyme subunit McrC
MAESIALREHQKSREVFLSGQELVALRQLSSDAIDLCPGSEPGGYVLKASSYVGIVVLPGGRSVVVEPKFPIETIFGLLAEVYDPDKKVFTEDPHAFTTVDALFEFMVRIFVVHVEDLAARGILHGYRVMTEDLAIVRGRILFSETLRRRPALRERHWCSYSHFTPDVVENRILRWTMLCLQPYPYGEAALSGRLHRASLALSGVELDPHARELFDRLSFHRLNDAYRPALDLARLLLDHLAFSGMVGEEPFLAYLIDMNWLFERYMGAVLRKAAARWGVRVAEQDSHRFDLAGRFRVRPDVVLYERDSPLLIIDAKYKPTEALGDLYEMLAYCHAVELGEAVLVHPASEEAPAGMVTARGPGSLSVHYLSLDLTGGPERLEAQAEAFTQQIEQMLGLGRG